MNIQIFIFEKTTEQTNERTFEQITNERTNKIKITNERTNKIKISNERTNKIIKKKYFERTNERSLTAVSKILSKIVHLI